MECMARKRLYLFSKWYPRSVKTIEIQIIRLVMFWCKNYKESTHLCSNYCQGRMYDFGWGQLLDYNSLSDSNPLTNQILNKIIII
jgi:hypothetical protein